jgi:hypothetical protein
MASANSFTWGSLLTPVNDLMSKYGVDSHVGIDVLVIFLILTILAYFGGKKVQIFQHGGTKWETGFCWFF